MHQTSLKNGFSRVMDLVAGECFCDSDIFEFLTCGCEMFTLLS